MNLRDKIVELPAAARRQLAASSPAPDGLAQRDRISQSGASRDIVGVIAAAAGRPYPTFHHPQVQRVIANAARWAALPAGEARAYGHADPLEALDPR